MAKLNLDTKEAAQNPASKPAMKMAEARTPVPPKAAPRRNTRTVPVAAPEVKTQKTAYQAQKITSSPTPLLRGFSSPNQMRAQTRLSEPSLWDKVKAPFARKTSRPDTVKKAEAPVVSAPSVNAPKAQSPKLEAPALRMPEISAPDFDTASIRKPKVKKWAEDIKAPFKTASRKWNTSSTERKIRDFQAKFQPIGTKIKTTFGSERNPIKAWMVKADRTFSYFGILLAMAFIASVLMLGIASPNSPDTKNY